MPTNNTPVFLHELSTHVTGDLRIDEYSRVLYSTDASLYQMMPHGVLIPRTAEDVHAAVELAAKYNVAVLPRGGGSSLAGQCVNEALVIDHSRHLNQVLEINTEEQWVRVQPGIVLDELNLYLAQYGYKFGPDPASSSRATMGGIVSNNSTGSHSILYGMTADHVIALKGILSDGTYVNFSPKNTRQLMQYHTRTGFEADIYRAISDLTYNDHNRAIIQAGTPRHWRRCGGYNLDRFINNEGVSFQYPNDPTFNLAKLICGAEGTLAMMTEITLNIVPLPTHSAIAAVHFAELKAALDAVPIMLDCAPSAIELLDHLGLSMAREVPAYARLMRGFVEGEPNCLLITEFYGENARELEMKIDHLRDHLHKHGVKFSAMTRAMSQQAQEDVWTVRKVGLGLLMSIKGDYKPVAFIEDSAVPVEHLTEYVLKIEEFCHSLGTEMAYYAHVSAGCLHIRPLINSKIATDIAKLPIITEFAVDLLGEYGGAFSSEHGDGRARSWLNEKFFGKDLYALYQQVKTIFDPHNIFNPGNVVEAGAMTENLRYGESYSVIPLHEHLDFSDDMGFARAIEMCNGAGVCRKRTTGTMCPSFQVTQEEEHSTRGRANLLRAAMSGTLPHAELTSQRLYDALDLCISCKACKGECPSSVDMAKIKIEFLAHYYEAHGIPLRARFFGRIAPLSKLASTFAPLANLSLKNGVVRGLLEKRLGIAHKRELQFAPQSFTRWFATHTPRPAQLAYKGVVCLVNDVYNTFNTPAPLIAATEVLEVLGYSVVLPGHEDVGRPALSKGLVAMARGYARDTLTKLAPFAEQNIPIVVIEPSDASALRDDYFALLPDDPRVELVAAATVTFDEFIAALARQEDVAAVFDQSPKQVLLHGHCHQKALFGTQASHQALAIANCIVNEVDSGCCGMAGSFGYESEHLAISLQMGERRLLPAVRDVTADTHIVTAGVSCRQQIKHGTGRRAIHTAELLQRALR